MFQNGRCLHLYRSPYQESINTLSLGSQYTVPLKQIGFLLFFLSSSIPFFFHPLVTFIVKNSNKLHFKVNVNVNGACRGRQNGRVVAKVLLCTVAAKLF